jgi:hypothetical protein
MREMFFVKSLFIFWKLINEFFVLILYYFLTLFQAFPSLTHDFTVADNENTNKTNATQQAILLNDGCYVARQLRILLLPRVAHMW